MTKPRTLTDNLERRKLNPLKVSQRSSVGERYQQMKIAFMKNLKADELSEWLLPFSQKKKKFPLSKNIHIPIKQLLEGLKEAKIYRNLTEAAPDRALWRIQLQEATDLVQDRLRNGRNIEIYRTIILPVV
jgi:hypothetical protein